MNFAEFVTGVNNKLRSAQQDLTNKDKELKDFQTRIEDLSKRCDGMQTMKDAEKDEKKLIVKVEEMLSALKDT